MNDLSRAVAEQESAVSLSPGNAALVDGLG